MSANGAIFHARLTLSNVRSRVVSISLGPGGSILRRFAKIINSFM